MTPEIIYGTHDDNTIAQFRECLKHGSAARGVLCADGHYGYKHPIGGVVAYRNHISVSGVGFDIACGNLAVRLDVKYDDIKHKLNTIASDISRHISFGVGRVNGQRVDADIMDFDFLWKYADAQEFRQMAGDQLGTVGSGNHYVDLFVEDATDDVWIGVHFGSRGLGHRLTTRTLQKLGATDGMDGPPVLIEAGTPLADEYRYILDLAGRYAYAGRQWVVDKVASIIGGLQTKAVHNHHNFMWIEEHFGENLYVVRKGATPAFPGQLGFVGGSMGDNAVILRGNDTFMAKESLYSTVHGAGRVMSRTAARGKVNRKTGEIVRPGLVSQSDMDQWLVDKGVLRVGGDLDEAPQAYRRLTDVLDAHADTVTVVHDLRPIVVVMAGRHDVDPYKD